MWIISLPLKVPSDDKSKSVKHRPGWEQPYFALNLNQYRNAHPIVLNNAKVNFNVAAKKLIRAAGVPKLERCSLEYVLYPGSAQLCDTNNICSVADKFFSDSLVGAGILPDDNYNFVVDSRFRFGSIDRQNPRVDVIIRNPAELTTLTPEKDPPLMKIQSRSIHVINMTKDDLQTAVREFLKNHIPVAPDTQLGPLKELQDGSYELVIEVGADIQPAPGRRKKADRLDPKEAMEALRKTQEEKMVAEVKETSPEPAQWPQSGSPPLPEGITRVIDGSETHKPVETRVEERVAEAEAEEEANEEPQQETEVSEASLAEESVELTPEQAVEKMRAAKTLAELDAAYEQSDKSKSATAIYGSCKDSLPVTEQPQKKKLFGSFTRPKND